MKEHAPRPECEKLVAASEDSQKIGAFLDWLNEQGIHLAEYATHRECEYRRDGRNGYHCQEGLLVYEDGDPVLDDGETIDDDLVQATCARCDGTGRVPYLDPPLMPRSERYESLLARYYGVDLAKVEEERRRLLEELRHGE